MRAPPTEEKSCLEECSTIVDVNDNQPILSSSRFFAKVLTIGTSVLQVFTTDMGSASFCDASIKSDQGTQIIDKTCFPLLFCKSLLRKKENVTEEISLVTCDLILSNSSLILI